MTIRSESSSSSSSFSSSSTCLTTDRLFRSSESANIQSMTQPFFYGFLTRQNLEEVASLGFNYPQAFLLNTSSLNSHNMQITAHPNRDNAVISPLEMLAEISLQQARYVEITQGVKKCKTTASGVSTTSSSNALCQLSSLPMDAIWNILEHCSAETLAKYAAVHRLAWKHTKNSKLWSAVYRTHSVWSERTKKAFLTLINLQYPNMKLPQKTKLACRNMESSQKRFRTPYKEVRAAEYYLPGWTHEGFRPYGIAGDVAFARDRLAVFKFTQHLPKRKIQRFPNIAFLERNPLQAAFRDMHYIHVTQERILILNPDELGSKTHGILHDISIPEEHVVRHARPTEKCNILDYYEGRLVAAFDQNVSDQVTPSQITHCILMWDLTNGLKVISTSHDQPICFLGFHNEKVYSISEDGVILEWDFMGSATPTQFHFPTLSKAPLLPLQLDDGCVMLGHTDGLFKLWNFRDNTCVLTIKNHGPVFAYDWNGRHLAVKSIGTINLWDLSTNKVNCIPIKPRSVDELVGSSVYIHPIPACVIHTTSRGVGIVENFQF